MNHEPKDSQEIGCPQANADNFLDIAKRIREERGKLRLSQEEFGEIFGVSHKTVGNWERGTGAPDARALSLSIAKGLDVMYVVTGKRSSAITERPATYSANVVESADEKTTPMSMSAAHAAAQDAISNNRPGVLFKPDALRAVLLDAIVNSKHYGHKWTTEEFIGIVIEMYEKYAQELSEGAGIILSDDDRSNETTGTHG